MNTAPKPAPEIRADNFRLLDPMDPKAVAAMLLIQPEIDRDPLTRIAERIEAEIRAGRQVRLTAATASTVASALRGQVHKAGYSFTVEEWPGDGSPVILAELAGVSMANAAWEAQMALHPEKRLVARWGGRHTTRSWKDKK